MLLSHTCFHICSKLTLSTSGGVLSIKYNHGTPAGKHWTLLHQYSRSTDAALIASVNSSTAAQAAAFMQTRSLCTRSNHSRAPCAC